MIYLGLLLGYAKPLRKHILQDSFLCKPFSSTIISMQTPFQWPNIICSCLKKCHTDQWEQSIYQGAYLELNKVLPWSPRQLKVSITMLQEHLDGTYGLEGWTVSPKGSSQDWDPHIQGQDTLLRDFRYFQEPYSKTQGPPETWVWGRDPACPCQRTVLNITYLYIIICLKN